MRFCPARSNDRSDMRWVWAILAAALATTPVHAQALNAQALNSQAVDAQGVDAQAVDTQAVDTQAVDARTVDGPTPRLAYDLELSASFRGGAWTNDRDLSGETLVAVASTRLRAVAKLGALDGFAEGYVQAASVNRGHGDLVEGWLRLTAGAFELRAGRQIVMWGRADRLNPTDVISARDYTLLVASDDEQRRGSLMAQIRLGLGLWTIDGFWLPEFRDNRFPLDRLRPGIAVMADQRVHDKGQFAIKIDRSGGRVDFSLSWFHGTDRTRDFVAVAPPTGFIAGVQQQFPQVDVYGGDLAGTAGPIGWRAEVAWSRYRGANTIYRKNDNLWAVIGADATVGNGWNLNLQYSFRRIFDFQDLNAVQNPIARAVALQSAAVNNQLGRTQNGLTFRVARKFFADTLDVEVAALGFFETGDAAFRPKLTYAINDRVRITAGADIFVGPTLSYFGRVRSLSAGYLQITHGF